MLFSLLPKLMYFVNQMYFVDACKLKVKLLFFFYWFKAVICIQLSKT